MSATSSPPGSPSMSLFADPEGYYPPTPPPTFSSHTMHSGTTLRLRLVGHNPLWSHHLWNAGRITSHYLETNADIVKDKTVLELGAGAGLPSLVCGILGAKKVVVTDYPDQDLVENLVFNVEHCGELVRDAHGHTNVAAEGYCWGADATALFLAIDGDSSQKFDVLILADLLFNHSEHGKLVATVKATLSKAHGAKALVFFSPYRPWLLEKDLAFFDLAREAGFSVEKVLEEKMEKVMFEDDRGDPELRRTVFGYEVAWSGPPP